MLPFSSFPTNAMSMKPVSEEVETVSNPAPEKRAEEAEITEPETVDVQAEEVEAEAETESRMSRSDEYLDPAISANSIGDKVVTSDWTLEGDTVVDELVVQDGNVDLNGYTLTVCKDLILEGGKIEVDNALAIWGDLRMQKRTWDEEAQEYVYGRSEGELHVNSLNEQNYVLVAGDMYVDSTYAYSFGYGILELKGNLYQTEPENVESLTFINNNLSFDYMHNLILSGDGQQIIQWNGNHTSNQMGNLYIENNSEEGIVFDGAPLVYSGVSMKRGQKVSGSIRIGSGYPFHFFDDYYGGDIETDNNGGVYIEEDVEIDGNLILSCFLTVYKGAAITINKDIIVKNHKDEDRNAGLNMLSEGKVVVLGNIDATQTTRAWNLYYNESGELYVKGDAVLDNVDMRFCDSTKFALEGNLDLRKYSGYSYMSLNSILNFCGTKKQEMLLRELEGDYLSFANLEISNTNAEGVWINSVGQTEFRAINTNGNKLYFDGKKVLEPFVLTEDTVIEEDCYFACGDIDLNGYTLTCLGDLGLSSCDVMVNHGTLDVHGDFIISGKYSSYLYMGYSDDEVIVHGDFVRGKGSMKAGELTVFGDFSSTEYFRSSEDHLTRIVRKNYTDEGKQKIVLYNEKETNVFANLELSRNADSYYESNVALENLSENISTYFYDEEKIDVVQNLRVVNVGMHNITIAFDEVTDPLGISGYEIWRDGKKIAEIEGTQYEDTGLTVDTEYTYSVYAKNSIGAPSREPAVIKIKAEKDTKEPERVENVATVTRSGSAITLSWDETTDNYVVAGYNVYRNNTKVAEGLKELTYKDTGLTKNTLYKYYVTAVDANGNESEKSEIHEEATVMPEIVRVTPEDYALVGGNIQNLTLILDNHVNCSPYLVKYEYFDESSQKWIVLLDSARAYIYTPQYNEKYKDTYRRSSYSWDLSEYTDENDIQVRYTVYDEDGNEDTLVHTYQVDRKVPEAVSEFHVTQTNSVLTFSWDMLSDLECKGYRLYRRVKGKTNYVEVAKIPGNTTCIYTDRTATVNVTYEYIVRAYDEFGQEGTDSEILEVTVGEDKESPVLRRMMPLSNTVIGYSESIDLSGSDNRKIAGGKLSVIDKDGNVVSEFDEEPWEYEKDGLSISLYTTYLSDGEYTVKACLYDEAGNESNVIERTYIVDKTAPEKVILGKCETSNFKGYLSWENVSANDLAHYAVERLEGENWVSKKVIKDKLYYELEDIQPDTEYSYRVCAYDERGNKGEYSDVWTFVTPKDTQGPRIDAIGPAEKVQGKVIYLQMQAVDDVGLSHAIFSYSTNGTDFTRIREVSCSDNVKVTTAWDTSVVPEGNVTIRFEVFDLAGNKNILLDGKEIETEYQIDRTAPSVPTGLVCENASGSAQLSWDTNEEEKITYYVYRGISEDGTYRYLGEAFATTFTDENVEEGETYFYKICAVDEAGNMSEKTAPISVLIKSDDIDPKMVSISPMDNTKHGQEVLLKAVATDNSQLETLVFELKEETEEEWHVILEHPIRGTEAYISKYWDASALKEDTKYLIRAKVIDKGGNESEYLQHYCYFDVTGPQTPVLSLETIDNTIRITATENTEEDFDYFAVYRREYETQEDFVCIGRTTEAAYTDSNVEQGKLYVYKFIAVDKYGNETHSASVSGYAETEDLTKPTITLPDGIVGVVGEDIMFDGSLSTDNTRIARYEWDFGDGYTSNKACPKHKYSQPGTYCIKLVVYDENNNVEEKTTKISIGEKIDDTGYVVFKITDINGQPLQAASIYVQELGISLMTGTDGTVSFAGKAGSYTLNLCHSEYRTREVTYTLEAGERSTASFELYSVAAIVGQMSSRKLSLQEIKDAGINLEDPDNYFIYESVVCFYYQNRKMPTMYVTLERSKRYTESDTKGSKHEIYTENVYESAGANTSEPVGTLYSCGNSKAIVLPAKVQRVEWLKNVYEVSLEIANVSEEAVAISNISAKINLKEGLSLASVTGNNNEETQTETSLGQNTSKRFVWYVRGDKPGLYDITCDVKAVYADTGQPFEDQYSCQLDVTEQASQGLHLYIMPEKRGYEGRKYYIQYKLVNESGETFYQVKTNFGKPQTTNRILKIQVVSHGKVVETKTTKKNVEYYLPDATYSSDMPSVGSGDSVTIGEFKPGESIAGTYVVDNFEYGDSNRWYGKLIATLVEETESSNAKINVTVDPIRSHIDIVDVVVQREVDPPSSAQTMSRGPWLDGIMTKTNEATQQMLKAVGTMSNIIYSALPNAKSTEDPINMMSGAFYTSQNLMSVAGVRDLGFKINYVSTMTENEGMLGYGWYHEYESHVADENGIIKCYVNPQSAVTFVKENAKEDVVYGTFEDGVVTILPYEESEEKYVPLYDAHRQYSLTKLADGYEVVMPDKSKYVYNTEGQLVRITNVQGQSIALGYGENTYSITDEATGRSIVAETDESGKITLVKDPAGNTAQFAYNEHGDLISITNKRGNTLTYEYTDHRIVKAWDTKGDLYLVNTYDEKGRVLTQDDGREDTPLATLTYTENEENDNVSIVVNGRNGGVQYVTATQDGKGLRHTDSIGGTTTYTYNDNGQMTSCTLPDGMVENYSYDEAGNLIKISNSASGDRERTYNENGQVVDKQETSGMNGQYFYDENNRMIKQVVNDIAINYSYNQNGQIVSSELENKGTTYYEYDEAGNVTTITYPDGSKEVFGYDILGNVISYTNRIGTLTSYEVDPNGNVVSESVSLKDGSKAVTSYTYDASGKILSKKDANGNTTSYAYDSEGNLIKETLANGSSITYAYDLNGKMTCVTYPDGVTTQTAVYDTAGNLNKIVDLLKGITTDELNVAGKLIRTTQADGGVVAYEYYDNGLLKSQTNAEGNKTSYAYNEAGKISEVVDPMGNKIKISYDNYGNIARIENGAGKAYVMTYNGYGEMTELQDPNGNKTKYTYDVNGNPVKSVDALGNVTEYVYDALGRIVSVTQKGNKGNDITTSYTYDYFGNITSVTNGEGNTFTASYDKVGNMTAIYDAYGQVVEQYVYDSVYNQVSVTNASGLKLSNTYDLLGNKIKTLNESNGSVTTYSYVGGNLINASTDALGGKTSATYDSMGNLESFTNPNGGITKYTYDKNQNVTSESVGDSYKISYTYDACGNVKTTTNSRGQITTYEYDQSGKVIKQTDEAGTITYEYDANGNQTSITEVGSGADKTEKTIKKAYDALNRVVRYEDSEGNVIKYAYDEFGNVTTVTYPNDEVVSYSYNKNGRVKTVTDWNGRVTSYDYDKNGRLIQTLRPDGSKEIRAYDKAGQLISIKDVSKDETIISDYTYVYDYTGNITGISNQSAKMSEDKSDAKESAQMEYDNVNRLIKYNGKEVKYDKDGNMIYGPLDGEMATFTYDCRNRLVKVVSESGKTTQYEYDAENVRTKVIKNVGTDLETITSYVTDTVTDELSRVLMSETTHKDGKSQVVLYSYGDGLIAQEKQGGENSEYWLYHYDNVGSTTAITDETGKIRFTYAYDTFGKLISGSFGDVEFLYNGQYGVASDDNGLYYMRARYYNINILRFINQDILIGSIDRSQSLNRYAYVEGNPISFLDPFGLEAYKSEYSDDHDYLQSNAEAFSNLSIGFAVAAFIITLALGPASLSLVPAMLATTSASCGVASLVCTAADAQLTAQDIRESKSRDEAQYYMRKLQEDNASIVRNIVFMGLGTRVKVAANMFGLNESGQFVAERVYDILSGGIDKFLSTY